MERQQMDVTVYTDGSHDKAGSRVGFGVVLILCGASVVKLGGSVDAAWLSNNYGIRSHEKASNPTMELIALAEALRVLSSMNKAVSLTVYSDYIGVQCWMTGAWKARDAKIARVLLVCKQRQAELEARGGTLKLLWVKGHSGDVWNDLADEIAGSEGFVDETEQLLKGM